MVICRKFVSKIEVVPSPNFPDPGSGFEWRRDGKRCEVTFLSQNVTFQVRCDAARFRIYFCLVLPKMWRFSWNLYKCADFVTSSHHFSVFGLEQTLASKPGQVLCSGFQVFQVRLGTTLTPCLPRALRTQRRGFTQLGRVLDSAFTQARVRLSCSDSLIYIVRYNSPTPHPSQPTYTIDELQKKKKKKK